MANYNFFHQEEDWSERIDFAVQLEMPWSLLVRLQEYAKAEGDSVESLVVEGISRAVNDRSFGAGLYGVGSPRNSDELIAMRRLNAEHEHKKRGIERLTGSSVYVEPIPYSAYRDLLQ